ncbi:hypothetical protein NLI96_g2373 [Meripilus lineatus]|uniref:UV excision repair protein RAD23 n=1 Tax=Meripilus lineatus TaxID=2056292 RepID=A0AAD5V8R4_9APHY|nr:hypothetical protein NLI96_g2373 [Physisporinus lineatus]
MKITIKTLQQKVFQVDAELSDTVADLKQRIHASQDHPIENQKLIYSGKVLKDDKTVEECNIKEKDFLVLMVSKPKASAAGTSSSAAPSTSTPVAPVPTPAAPAEPTTPAPAPVAAAPQPPNAPILTPATATPIEALAPPPQAERAFGDMSSFLTGSQLQSTIQNMIEMGFEREQVMRALRASYNNPDRAVEYLFNVGV